MTVTFPHMGYLDLVLETVFHGLGQDVIVPERPGKKTLERGVRHSPELACLPFKMNLGDLLYGVEQGADTILCVVDEGPCRLGYYGTVHQSILRKMGYDVDLIPFEYLNPIAFLARMKGLGGGTSWERAFSALRLGWRKLCVLDEIHAETQRLRSHPSLSDEVERTYVSLEKRIRNASTFHALRTIRKKARKMFKEVTPTQSPALKVALLGEIYVVLEPAVNLHIERLLARMGVQVVRCLYLSHSIRTAMFMDPFSRHSKRRALRWAKPYLSVNVGAECNQSVGKTLIHASEGCDGVIHLLPFTCAPELVARTVLTKAGRDHDIPFLSVVLDEHTGEAGLMTRLEAFVDLLTRRKQKR